MEMKEQVLVSFSDLIAPIAKFAIAKRKLKQATNWIPENEKAKGWLKKKQSGIKLSDNPVENDLLKSAKNRNDQLLELGDSKLEDFMLQKYNLVLMQAQWEDSTQHNTTETIHGGLWLESRYDNAVYRDYPNLNSDGSLA